MSEQSIEAKAGVQEIGSPTGDSPSSNGNTPAAQPPAQPSVNGQGQAHEKVEQVPFGDKRHPEYRRFKELTDTNREYKKQLEQIQREMAELRGFKDSTLAQRSPQEQIAPEQKQALMQLFQMGLTVPEVKKMFAEAYGLDRLDSLHKDYSSFKENWEGQQYEGEMREVLKHAESLGLNADEVEQELQEHVSSHPFFADKSYYKGGVWAAFRDKYWDKAGELREREQNKKTVEERERLKGGQTQAPVNNGASASPALPKEDGVRRNVEIIKRMGGADKLPFFNR